VTEHYLQSPATQALAMAELARAALPKWNVSTAEVTLLKLRENAVFRVDVPGGRSYVMRIHRHNYHSDAELHSELQWLTALANAGIEAPLERERLYALSRKYARQFAIVFAVQFSGTD